MNSLPANCLLPVLVMHLVCSCVYAAEPSWDPAAPDDGAHARHENAFVESGGRFYLLGGRRIQPVDIFDPASGSWSTGSAPPIELHHFQAVSHGGLIHVIAAQTGKYPAEAPVTHVWIYDPVRNEWRRGAEIPEHRRRGSAGVVVHEGRFYVVAGIRDGHRSGWVPWLDVYDPETGEWTELADAPRARDHFHAALVGGRIYAAGGRRSGSSRPVFAGEVAEVDIYDIAAGTWSTLPPSASIPTLRAGTTVAVVAGTLAVMGGESTTQKEAHGEVEVLDSATLQWTSLPPLSTPRHGAQALVFDGAIWIAGGNATRGGGNERVALEKLPL